MVRGQQVQDFITRTAAKPIDTRGRGGGGNEIRVGGSGDMMKRGGWSGCPQGALAPRIAVLGVANPFGLPGPATQHTEFTGRWRP